jgi:hypothetical protein
MFTGGYGFVVDYLAEILRKLRTYDYTHHYQEHFLLSEEISTRDRDGVNKTFSGLMKILFPSGEASKEDVEMILEFAIEGRKRVKDQLLRIDTTYPDVSFGYTRLADGSECKIQTAEEKLYPQHYYQKPEDIKKKKLEPAAVKKPVAMQPDLSEEEKLIALGENDKLEFKSTLRWNLKIDKVDKDIEHSVLKTIAAYLNTEGGILLVGVDDDGNVLGIENDKFPSDDKFLLYFSNMISDKLGAHYLEQIKWGLIKVKEKKILRVDCKPSPTAVFLNDGREFYVRNGPSSRSLSVSDTLEYCKKHFR